MNFFIGIILLLDRIFSSNLTSATLVISGILMAACFIVLTYLPKFIENPYNQGAVLNTRIEERNKKLRKILKSVKRVLILLFITNCFLWSSFFFVVFESKMEINLFTILTVSLRGLGELTFLISLIYFGALIFTFPLQEITAWEE